MKEVLEKRLKDIENIEFAYLFGSYADKSYKRESDVDIALYLRKYDFDIELGLNFELSKLLNRDVDLVILNRVKNLYLLDDILQKGLLLKDSESRIKFELKKYHQILDYKEFKKSIHAA